MSTAITKKFITTDTRFDLAEKVLRALLPGAVLVAKYAADAPRGPDIPAPPVPPGDAQRLDHYPGDILDTAVPEHVELEFMPPPGLDFDSRHILFGLFETAEVVDTARAKAWNDITAEIDAWVESNSAESLPESVVAVSHAIQAQWAAACARDEYLIAKTSGDAVIIAAAPTAERVIDLDVEARRLRIAAVAILRNEESTLLAPSVAERGSRGAVAAPT